MVKNKRKVLYLSIQDLKDLGLLKKYNKRKHKKRYNKYLLQNNIKSQSNMGPGYTQQQEPTRFTNTSTLNSENVRLNNLLIENQINKNKNDEVNNNNYNYNKLLTNGSDNNMNRFNKPTHQGSFNNYIGDNLDYGNMYDEEDNKNDNKYKTNSETYDINDLEVVNNDNTEDDYNKILSNDHKELKDNFENDYNDLMKMNFYNNKDNIDVVETNGSDDYSNTTLDKYNPETETEKKFNELKEQQDALNNPIINENYFVNDDEEIKQNEIIQQQDALNNPVINENDEEEIKNNLLINNEQIRQKEKEDKRKMKEERKRIKEEEERQSAIFKEQQEQKRMEAKKKQEEDRIKQEQIKQEQLKKQKEENKIKLEEEKNNIYTKLFLFHTKMTTTEADQKARLAELEKVKTNKIKLLNFEKDTTEKQRTKYIELRSKLGLEPDPDINNNNLTYNDIGKKINKLLKSNK